MDRNYDVITLFKNTVILRRPGVAIFADTIKIITRFIKKIFKVSGKVKRIRNYVLKSSLYLYYLIYQNLLISSQKMLMSAEIRGVSLDWYIFWTFFRQGITVPSFIIVGCVTDFRKKGGEGAFCPSPPPICEQPQKCPSWIGLTAHS